MSQDGTVSERNDLKKMDRELHGDSEYERLRDEEKKEEFGRVYVMPASKMI